MSCIIRTDEPDEGRRLQRPKRCINNNQDEDSPNNTTHTNNTSSQKYRDLHSVFSI